MRLRIALCDPDLDYARRISEYARNSEVRKEAEVTVCTRPELLGEWRSEGKFDVYAVGVEWGSAIGAVDASDRSVVWLSESGHGIGPNGAAVVRKYESAPNLLRRWIERGASDGGRSDASSIVGIWSASGGSGRSRLIEHLAAHWARKGRRTFVAAVDPHYDSSIAPAAAVYYDVADWLFDIKSNRPAAREAGAGAALQSFAPDCSYREWSRIGRGEGEKLLEAASAAASGGIVLADAGGGWSPWAEAVCARADTIVCVASKEPASVAKTEKWLRDWPEWEEGGTYRSKTVFVLNRCLRDAERVDADWERSAFRLPYVPEWKQDAARIDPMFRRASEQLAEELMGRCEAR